MTNTLPAWRPIPLDMPRELPAWRAYLAELFDHSPRGRARRALFERATQMSGVRHAGDDAINVATAVLYSWWRDRCHLPEVAQDIFDVLILTWDGSVYDCMDAATATAGVSV